MPARAMAATSERRPVPWLGSTITGRWLSSRISGTALRSSVLRVYGLEGADAALAEDDLVVALREDVLGGEQPLLHRRRHAALEQDRLAQPADLGEQGEVLHVAGADLEHVGHLV